MSAGPVPRNFEARASPLDAGQLSPESDPDLWNLPESGRILARFGRIRPNPSQIWPTSDQKWRRASGSLGPISDKVRLGSANFEPTSADVGSNATSVGPDLARSEQTSSDLGRPRLGLLRSSPDIRQGWRRTWSDAPRFRPPCCDFAVSSMLSWASRGIGGIIVPVFRCPAASGIF